MTTSTPRLRVPHLIAHLALTFTATSALAQARTMSVRGNAATGLSVAFEHRGPLTAAGSIVLHALTPHYVGAFPLQIPGLAMVGTAQIDAAQVWMQTYSLLSPTGASEWSLSIPFQPIFVGVAFDVQSLDLDATVSTIHWAQSDAELTIASFAPPVSFDMVAIQPGTFSMGSTSLGFGTPHPVTISSAFWVGAHEVTQAEFLAVMGSNPSFFQGPTFANEAQRPVEQVSWHNAVAYCTALNAAESAMGRLPLGYQYRLPTEAEWEYVCRAGTTTDWNTGANLPCDQANYGLGFGNPECLMNPGQTTIVGGYQANAWGLYDTHGNVWEWCLDSWDFTANYPSGPVSDPYVTTGHLRVARGGAWNFARVTAQSAYRGNGLPIVAHNTIGFRVVLAPALLP